MNAIVIYDSNFGNTEKVAQVIAFILNCEAIQVKKFDKSNIHTYDLLVIGSPINAWTATPAIKDFLKTINPMKGTMAAAFDTRVKVFFSGNAAKKISKKLTDKGAIIIAEPRGFYVEDKEVPLLEGEIENATEWAKELKHEYDKRK